MLFIVIQLLVALLAVALAGVKSAKFTPSDLSDFELQRLAKNNDPQAKAEQYWRARLPLVEALRQVVLIVLTLAVVVLLTASNPLLWAIPGTIAWLLLSELLAVQAWFGRRVDAVVQAHRSDVERTVESLRPVLGLFARQPARTRLTFGSTQEFLDMISRDDHVLHPDQKKQLAQVMKYASLRVKDVMTPRDKVITVRASDVVGPLLLDKLHKAGHSYYPVAGKDIDHIQGILYARNLLPLDPQAKKVDAVMERRLFYVQQDQPLDHVLRAFARTQQHLFVVVNEFEEVRGVVSIEDVIGALTGRRIEDAFDQYDNIEAVSRLTKMSDAAKAKED